MIYFWAMPSETPNKMIGKFEYNNSPCNFLFMRGDRFSQERLGRCLLYVRSQPFTLPDDLFLRMELRPEFTPAYIFIGEELFYFDCTMPNKINILAEQVCKLKMALNLAEKDIDQPAKKLSDSELNVIAEHTKHYFSRVPTITFSVKIEKLIQLDCLASNSCAPIVNGRLKKILETIAPDDVQFFPAKLICKDGELKGYYFINITNTFTGVDYKKSIYKESNSIPIIFFFKHIVYKPDSMGKHFIARDKNHLTHLLVSEDLKVTFEREKITGVSFIPPESYYRPFTAADLIAEEQAILRENEEGDE